MDTDQGNLMDIRKPIISTKKLLTRNNYPTTGMTTPSSSIKLDLRYNLVYLKEM